MTPSHGALGLKTTFSSLPLGPRSVQGHLRYPSPLPAITTAFGRVDIRRPEQAQLRSSAVRRLYVDNVLASHARDGQSTSYAALALKAIPLRFQIAREDTVS